MEALAAKRRAIVDEWLARTLEAYPEHASSFLARGEDPFGNPVGHAFKEAFPVLVDELLGGMNLARIAPLLDQVVKIRAVQDFTPSQAVAFVFLLKRVVREALDRPPHPPLSPSGGEDKGEGAERAQALATLDERIDAMALLAFDLFVSCRERMYAIKVNDARRRAFLLARIQEQAEAG